MNEQTVCDINKVSAIYFKSDAHMYAFALNHTDGSPRVKLLGLTMEHYENIQVTKKWFDNIQRILLDCTDESMIPEIKEAILRLSSLYHRMAEGMVEYDES